MNAALDHIEANLAGDIDMKAVARKACCSVYHFTRMFSFITNVPLNEYIRRRRLTMAGFELLNSDARVTDIALKYGYDSPNSFSRAFQAVHGITPSAARAPVVELKSFAQISFIISIKEDVSMNYRIVEEGQSALFGVSLTTKASDAYETIPLFGISVKKSESLIK